MVATNQKMSPRRKRLVKLLRLSQRRKQTPNDLLWVMEYHLESMNLACIINKICNVNADTRLENAKASIN